MRFRFRTVAAVGALLVVASWLAPVGSMAAPVAKPTVHTIDTASGRMMLRVFPPAKPGTPRPSASDIRKTVAADPLDCGENGSCIECDVFAWLPQAADTIITYEGATYCFYPDIDYMPAIVPEIDMTLGLMVGCCHGVVARPYSRQETDHLDITDANRCIAPDWYATAISVVVFFPECCPLNASAGGVTDQYYVGCRPPPTVA